MEYSNYMKRQLELEVEENPSPLLSDDLKEEEAKKNDISSSLIHELGRDISIHCLLRLSRSDYGLIATLNRSFRSLVRTGELYQLRRKMGIVEHWIYLSCSTNEWKVFDPNRRLWMQLPNIICGECFRFSNKESLAVGTEVLVFGWEIGALAIYKYSLLTNAWSVGEGMNTPRSFYGSASMGEIGIFAGGSDLSGNISSVVELYNSDTGKWETLPNLNIPRKMCSSVFMDGKFYVIGGIGVDGKKKLSCCEEFDLKTRKWRQIPDMFHARNEGMFESPPLIAVVNNVLYAADHATKELKKYVKESNTWVTIGRLPDQTNSMCGWGMAFRACGDMLIVITGCNFNFNGFVEVYGWVVNKAAPQWNLLGRRYSGKFVFNCTVMGC